MTPEQLESLAVRSRAVLDSFVSISALNEIATPGPWEVVDDGPGGTNHGVGSVVTLAEGVEGGDIAEPSGDCYPRSGYNPGADMHFIASSRTAVPTLLGFLTFMVEYLEEEVEKNNRKVKKDAVTDR